MAPEVLRRAFDPFFTTKPEGQGSGLGLAVARGLVEGHGGALWLESAPGQGTRAILELPEAAPQAERA
jgi:signal transduction histidine kinase